MEFTTKTGLVLTLQVGDFYGKAGPYTHKSFYGWEAVRADGSNFEGRCIAPIDASGYAKVEFKTRKSLLQYLKENY